eukprot:2315852-Amphidinium_carterae.1
MVGWMATDASKSARVAPILAPWGGNSSVVSSINLKLFTKEDTCGGGLNCCTKLVSTNLRAL